MKPVGNPEIEEALTALGVALDRVAEAGVAPKDARDAATIIRRVETLGRRVDALQTRVVAEVDESMSYAADGHHSAKVMVRHVAKLSNAEAAGRDKAARALRALPMVAAAYEAGEIGTCQVRCIARAFANRRVSEQLIRDEAEFVRLAKHRSYRDFEAEVADWVRLVDEDGTADTSEANHLNREARITQEFNGGWRLEGRFGSLQGAQLNDILEHFTATELHADIEAARALHGDDVTITRDMLERTDAQRRADAFSKAMAAGACNPDGGGKTTFQTTIVLDQETFERQLARVAGADVAEPDPWRPSFQARTLNGARLDTREAAAAALVDGFRRAVVDASGATIDLSHRRCFTGASRLAVQLMNCTCAHAGCEIPVSDCQIDHITPHSRRGRTHPGNGAPACGRHNRFHHTNGYRTLLAPDGRWHTYRPDGTEV